MGAISDRDQQKKLANVSKYTHRKTLENSCDLLEMATSDTHLKVVFWVAPRHQSGDRTLPEHGSLERNSQIP
jgi:hypothetical protein